MLKSLVEDGEMRLADGRRLLSADRYEQEIGADEDENVICIHPDFRLWVLANRPGGPFLGNDFFRAIGDVFSSHIISNPDTDSEMELLRCYGPSVDEDILRKLVDCFAELRRMVDTATLTYPYSTREAVSIVKHLEKYPADGVVETIENVLGFDWDRTVRKTVTGVFQRHGIPIPSDGSLSGAAMGTVSVRLGSVEQIPEAVKTEVWKTGPTPTTDR